MPDFSGHTDEALAESRRITVEAIPRIEAEIEHYRTILTGREELLDHHRAALKEIDAEVKARTPARVEFGTRLQAAVEGWDSDRHA